jgi:hypothetical protein
MAVGISPKLGEAKLYEFREVKVRGFIAECEECLEACRVTCMRLKSRREGRDMVISSGR